MAVGVNHALGPTIGATNQHWCLHQLAPELRRPTMAASSDRCKHSADSQGNRHGKTNSVIYVNTRNTENYITFKLLEVRDQQGEINCGTSYEPDFIQNYLL